MRDSFIFLARMVTAIRK